MSWLPIVERELRVRAKLKSTIRFRLLAAIGAILLMTMVLLAHSGGGAQAGIGSTTFGLLSWLALLYCLMEGPRNTADSLSREKRDGTLGLLFLTDLRGHDVVLGKLAAHSLNSVYGLLAIFPPLAIPLVLGGVTPDEFWRHVLALINALFFSLTFGLFVSAVARDERTTWMATTSGILLMGILPLFFLWSNSAWTRWSALSPISALILASDGNFTSRPGLYWRSLQSVQLASWTLLALASVLLPRLWQDRPDRSRAASGNTRVGHRPSGPPSIPLAESNPIAWLTGRDTGTRRGLWLVVGAACFTGILIWMLNAGSTTIVGVLFFAMMILHLGLAVWMASEACHVLGWARDSGALELLLATPLRPKEIYEGCVIGLRSQFARPVAALLIVEAGIALGEVWMQSGSGAAWLAAAGIGLIQFAFTVELKAVAAFGLWMGLTTPRPARAVTKTVLYVLVFPLITVFCSLLFPIISLLKSVVFLNYGRDQLMWHLRTTVAEQLGAPEVLVANPRLEKMRLPPVLPR